MSGDLRSELERFGQDHLLAGWDQLDAAAQVSLTAQLRAVDWDRLDRLLAGPAEDASFALAGQAGPPPLVRLPETAEDRQRWDEASERGWSLLAAGRVAVLTVAGGLGTRLGFGHPKGLFPIMPVSGKSLFEHFAESVRARGNRAGCRLPWLVMTSDATHEETESYFREHDYFGIDPDDVWLFRQGNMPTVDATSRRVLLSGPGHLALKPDGHGGLLEALQQAGMFPRLAERGVEQLFSHQVDNPAVLLADPPLLGWHDQHGSRLTTRVVSKRSAEERMGVVVEIEGAVRILEYFELPPERAAATDDQGRLLLRAGNTAVHVLDLSFLEQVAGRADALPFHQVEVGQSTAGKTIGFERFLFDLLPLTDAALVVESDRETEFLPLKNIEGVDSPERVQQGLVERFGRWLIATGADVSAAGPVEISPLFAQDADELAAKVAAGTRFEGTVRLTVD